MTELSHVITVTVVGRYPHGEKQHASVTVAGDGSLDHMLDTFKASLVAAGFSAATAERLDVQEGS